MDVADLETPLARHPQHVEAAAVDIGRSDDVIAGLKQFQHR